MITIPERHLVACLAHAGKQEVRYYLNGVAVEVTAAGRVVCIGTDGTTLFAVTGGSVPDGTPAQTIIVPRDIVERIKPGKRRDFNAVIVPPSPGDHPDDWTMQTAGGSFGFMPMKASYPDWRSVIRSRIDPPEVAQFDPELVMRFTLSARVLLGQKDSAYAAIAHQGARAAVVSIPSYPDAAGVVMPWEQRVPDSIPSWIHDRA